MVTNNSFSAGYALLVALSLIMSGLVSGKDDSPEPPAKAPSMLTKAVSVWIGEQNSKGVLLKTECVQISSTEVIERAVKVVTNSELKPIKTYLFRPPKFIVFLDAKGNPIEAFASFSPAKPANGLIRAKVEKMKNGNLKIRNVFDMRDGLACESNLEQLLLEHSKRAKAPNSEGEKDASKGDLSKQHSGSTKKDPSSEANE